MEILAQESFTSVPGASVAIWMAILAAALFLWNQANEALDRRKEKPDPVSTYATEANCRQRHAEARDIAETVRLALEHHRETQEMVQGGKRKEIYDMIRASGAELRTEMKERFDGMESRLNDITRALGRLEGHHD